MNHRSIAAFLLTLVAGAASSQTITGTDQFGNYQELDDRGGRFNPHSNDSTKKNKVVPKGIYVWTVDRKLGDITRAEVDTLPDLYPQSTLTSGRYGDYNSTGSNYSARLSRIFIDRPDHEQFIFTQAFDQVQKTPDQVHFTNTLSPITNLSYDNCGDKTNGEDHLQARFAVNAGKRIGIGFDVNYAYARGYFQNQSISHFNSTFYGSYLGDRYQLHAIVALRHQKVAENGGITEDNYITHPELTSETYSDNEIPTVLSSNWNRYNSTHLFLTHRYSLGFYRKVKMTDEEIKARQFAQKSSKQHEAEKRAKGDGDKAPAGRPDGAHTAQGRPDGARVAGREPAPVADSLRQASDSLRLQAKDSLQLAAADSLTKDSTSNGRVKVTSKAMADSLLAVEAAADSLSLLMKDEYVPVTSFIHTLELDNFDRIYQAYQTPSGYYRDKYFSTVPKGYAADSIYDQAKHFDIKNTLGVALLEGFNKYAKAGLKAFATHELRRFEMPQTAADSVGRMERWTEHNVSVGARLSKTQGSTLHYNLTAETWLIGEDAGQLKVDFSTDLNFPLWGDTVRLAANAYFHRLNPTFFERRYHSKHFWWDNGSLEQTTRTRLEGVFSYDKTNTRLRVAIEELQNYTYFSMGYTTTTAGRTGIYARLNQQTSNINVLTAQLDQKLAFGPLHWDNILTYQSTSNEEVLPLPSFNVFSNLYFRFIVARVLRVELGGSATYFTKYNAPDYCPQVSQFAVQENPSSRVEIGNFPFVDLYANLHLKHARFFFMMANVTGESGNRMTFLAPHYPVNRSTFHMGVSWNFFN